MSSNTGTLFIIAAPSGAGKTSLVRFVVSELPDLVISVSHTTRQPRPGEVNGQNYHFVSEETFQSLKAKQVFLESATVFGYDYGTSGDWVNEQLAQGKDVILEIDWQGAQQIRLLHQDAVSVFIVPPSMAVLRQRLKERAQDSQAVIEKRMQAAREEISHYHEFDYLLVNDNFEIACDDLKSIIKSHRLQSRHQHLVHEKLLESLLSV